MRKIALLTLFVTTIYSCVSEEEQKVIDAVQNIVQAESAAVGSGTSIDTKKGEISYKTLTLKSGDRLNNSEISDESISSVSALIFYQNLPSSTLEGKDAIKIILERNFNGTIKTIENMYYKDTLEIVSKTMVYCEKLGEAFVNKNYKEVYNQFVNDLKVNIEYSDFERDLKITDHKIGNTKSYTIKGFEINKAKRNDGSKFPIVHFWMDLDRDSTLNHVDVYYNLVPDSIGILNIDL